jgi:hypothetical protein
MRAHDVDLCRIQPPRLEQNLIRDRDFADIVQRRSARDPFCFLAR